MLFKVQAEDIEPGLVRAYWFTGSRALPCRTRLGSKVVATDAAWDQSSVVSRDADPVMPANVVALRATELRVVVPVSSVGVVTVLDAARAGVAVDRPRTSTEVTTPARPNRRPVAALEAPGRDVVFSIFFPHGCPADVDGGGSGDVWASGSRIAMCRCLASEAGGDARRRSDQGEGWLSPVCVITRDHVLPGIGG
jgi:hypothetical protein